jgi:hypothetical protein
MAGVAFAKQNGSLEVVALAQPQFSVSEKL